jgi:hypothetical protein
MVFSPNVSFSSLVILPIIQRVKLDKMSKQMIPIKCDVKCDNIVKNNFSDLTNKISSNPIKQKLTPIENIQNHNNIKDNVIGPSSKNIPHHVVNKKETNMGCDFRNKNILKPFNGTSRNEEHLNNFV